MSLYFFARYDWLILCACDGAVCAKRKKRYCAMTPHNPRRHENGKKRYDSFRSTIFDECTHSGFPKVDANSNKQCSPSNDALWNSTAPLISSRQPKTAMGSGSAFRTQSLDRMYTNLSPTIGYNVYSRFTITDFLDAWRNVVSRIIAIFKLAEQIEEIPDCACESTAVATIPSNIIK